MEIIKAVAPYVVGAIVGLFVYHFISGLYEARFQCSLNIGTLIISVIWAYFLLTTVFAEGQAVHHFYLLFIAIGIIFIVDVFLFRLYAIPAIIIQVLAGLVYPIMKLIEFVFKFCFHICIAELVITLVVPDPVRLG